MLLEQDQKEDLVSLLVPLVWTKIRKGRRKEMIKEPNGKPYLSITEKDNQLRIRLHSYDEDFPKGIYLTIDKRAIPALIEELKEHCETRS